MKQIFIAFVLFCSNMAFSQEKLVMTLFSSQNQILGKSEVNIPTSPHDQLFVSAQNIRCEVDSLSIQNLKEPQAFHLTLTSDTQSLSVNGVVMVSATPFYVSLNDEIFCSVEVLKN